MFFQRLLIDFKQGTPVLPIIFLMIILLSGCKENDDLPPVLTLNGEDSVSHILNSVYNDQGAEAIDETDGNITKSIFIESNLDVNKIGEYTVTYHVVDQAGNVAAPISRMVFVFNESYIYSWTYNVSETQLFPEYHQCSYDIYTRVDSFINRRILFSSLNCDFGQPVYADVNDTGIILPFQTISDTIQTMSLQGSGSINDTSIHLDYTLKTDTVTQLWEAGIIRSK